MRPRRLELEGFTAFRRKTVVDFTDADLFAFVGPTGSGKSSLVDAVLFALYGTVPRYGDRRAVEPVISLGRNEARVRFDFSVGDTDYSAVRVVRRQPRGGAAVKEARLEGGGESVMGAKEVAEAVEDLLGLGFDHFTKCVVLPQGEFAAFLHDSPAKRQELLRQLLDLGRYRRIRDLAVDRQRKSENMVEVLNTQIADLSFATDEALASAETRSSRLESLRERIDALEPEMASSRAAMGVDNQAAEAAKANLDLVRNIKAPSGLDKLMKAGDEMLTVIRAAEEEVGRTSARLKELEVEAVAMTDATAIARLGDLHQRLAEGVEAEKKNGIEVEAAEQASREAGTALAAQEKAFQDAAGRLAELRAQHAAHALRDGLGVGEPCPVCRQQVDALPTGEKPAALEQAEGDLKRYRDVLATASTTAATASEQLAAAKTRLAGATDRTAELREQLSDSPDAKQTKRLRQSRVELDRRLVGERAAAKKALDEFNAARERAKGNSLKTEAARRRFDAVRDDVAAMKPPVPGRQRLDDDWSALATWAGETEQNLLVLIDQKTRSVREIEVRLGEKETQFKEELASLDLMVGDRRVRDVCTDALATAKQQAKRITEARAKAVEFNADRERHIESAEISKTLARLLAANGFEGWLMEEALVNLVDGANRRLGDLSTGAFSLEIEKRDFLIVDHRNADERRSIRTLSGGETFLVSLALALALAEQLSSMSEHGVARLESMFLDEGFGTLDAESLDVVATVIHELGSDGRAIGLITHVQDLAEQVPVRFEVRKGPGGATVERVDA